MAAKVIFNPGQEKPDIEYPCNWSYKIIGTDVDEMIIAVEEIVLNMDYDLTPSNISSNQKYYSLNLRVLVESETVRNLIFQKLEQHTAISFVL